MADDTGMAALAHILAFFTGFLGPLIIMLATDDEFAEQNARNALNFQIVLFIGYFISVVMIMTLLLAIIGLPLLFALLLIDFIFCMIAGIKAHNGEEWKYPLTPDLV